MGKRGKMRWSPIYLDLEVEDIKRENRLTQRTEAVKDLVKYARVGREFERLMKLDFKRKKRLPDIDEIMKGRFS